MREQVVANATVLADELLALGYNLVSGGTDTHLILIDLSPKGWTGKAAEKALEKAGITVNKNMVPFDPQKPMTTSGVRVGTPAVTTRGMKEGEMKGSPGLIDRCCSTWMTKPMLQAVQGRSGGAGQPFPALPETPRVTGSLSHANVDADG